MNIRTCNMTCNFDTMNMAMYHKLILRKRVLKRYKNETTTLE